MSTSARQGGRLSIIAAAATAILVLLGGAFVARALTDSGAPPQPARTLQEQNQQERTSQAVPSAPQPDVTAPDAPQPPPSASPTARTGSSFGPLLAPSPPVTLTIPSIGVRTRGIVDLGLDKNGKLEAPTDFDRAGWYAAGPTPGEFGPAVIGAHVDSKAGPAVFYRLGSLRKGAVVLVGREDGSTARFVVDRVARYPKNDFPTATVYADTKGRAELRLITCGGAFDQATGHYVDNIVAFAHLKQ